MDYDFSRIDYTVCGITYPDTLKILPGSGQKSQQKFAIGDKNGVLQCLSIKDEEPVIQFKTLPGKPITSVQLISSKDTNSDKIFAASGNEVKGYTRKGKVFLCIETSISETITSMSVLGGDLILCSGYTITYYRDLQELYSYTCEDRVLDIAAFAAPNSTRVRLLVLIANKGATILENGQLIARAHISSGPSRLAVPPSMHLTVSSYLSFYGAADGSVGIIMYEESKLSSKCVVEGGGLGSVVCMGWYTYNSSFHLAIGRHDGSIQLYLLNTNDFGDKPRLKYTYFSGEPVTSVCGGAVGTEENELLVATFSGRIFSLRSRRLSSQTILNNTTIDAFTARRVKLEMEVARLEKQTANERDKYQRNTRSPRVGVSAPPLLDIQYELSGATINEWQEIKITSAVPLDMLFIHCNKKLDIQTDSAAVLSMCTQQGKDTDSLATVRCQAGTRRFWMRVRIIRDRGKTNIDSTQIFIYVLPAGAPRVARLIKLQLPALPYYSKHEDYDTNDNRFQCELRVKGSFSVAEMTSWLAEALPGDLPRPAASVTIARSHTLLGTFLVCRYQRGLAIFKSDNVSSIAVIKEVISNSSIKKSIELDMSCEISDDCCVKSLQRIRELLESEYERMKSEKLRKALSALDLNITTINNESEPLLCKDYKIFLDSMTNDCDTKESYFEELIGMIEEWYIDWSKLSLQRNYYRNENNTIQLRTALQNCWLEEVIHFFTNNVAALQAS